MFLQVHITNTTDPKFGGEGIAALGLSKAISKQNEDVILISRQITKNLLNLHKISDHFSILYLKKHFIILQFIYDFYHINSVLNKKKPVIVHLHGIWTPFITLATILCLWKKIDYVISPHGCLETWALNHKKFKKKMAMFLYQRVLLKKSRCLVVNSNMEYLNASKLDLKIPIAIIPNAISNTPKQDQIKKYNSKRTKNSPKNLLFFSRIHKKKGVDYLIKAWVNCNKKNWVLNIVGPGEENYVRELKQLIKRLNVQNVNLRAGFVSDKIKTKLLKNANGFILPTKSENFGIVIIEAMSYGIPVITTHEAPWEEIFHKDCGWWVKANIKSISGAINKLILISDKERFQKGINGHKLVSSKYTWDSKGVKALSLHSWLHHSKNKKPSFVYSNNLN